MPVQYSNLQINTTESERFLEALFGKHITSYVFCTFPDNKLLAPAQKKALTKQFIGTFDQHKDALIHMNERGAGIFVTVNLTNMQGRKKSNITNINAVFIEADNGAPQNLPIRPSLVVTSSPGKFHYYFLVDPTDSKNFDEFDGVMHTMVEQYKCDPNAKDLSRVLRLPGFAHVKSKQFTVTFDTDNTQTQLTQDQVSANQQYRYTWADIKRHFPPSQKHKQFTKAGRAGRGPEYVPNTSRIVSMLSYLNPECSRIDWLNTLMSLHYEYMGSDRGLEIALQWSRGELYKNSNAKPENYLDDDDIITRWNSFSYNSPNKANQRTLGSLTNEAKANGWKTDAMSAASIAVKFIEQETVDILKKISSLYGVANLPGGGAKIVRRNPQTGRYVLESAQDMKLSLSGVNVPSLDEKSKKIVYKPVFSIWINSKHKLKFLNSEFRPMPDMYCSDNTTEIEVDQNPDRKSILNLYYGTHIRPLQGSTALIEQFVQEIIANNDKDTAEYVHNWCAHLVQKPHVKTGVMITLMGKKGSGKSVMAELIEGLMYPHTYETSNFDDLIGQFNDHITRSNLIVLEEATWGGKERDNSKLKDLLTNSKLACKTKFISNDADARSYINIISTANPGFAVPEDMRKEERRFFTISVSDAVVKNKQYFSQFGKRFSEKREELLSAYMHFLKQRDISGFDPQTIPDTVGEHARYNQIENSGSGLKFLLNIIETEELVTYEIDQLMGRNLYMDGINSMWTQQTDPVYVPVKLVKDSYEKFARSSRSSKIDTAHIINELAKFIPINKRKSPSSSVAAQYEHLDSKGKYLMLPNRSEAIQILVDSGLIDPNEYAGEY